MYKIALPVMTLLFLLTGCKQDNCGNRETATVVETARAEQAPTQRRKEYSFITTPLHTSQLSFRVPGYVEEFDAYVGSYYKQGSEIAALDNRDYRLRYEQTEATYRRAKAEYERMETLYKKDNIAASTYEQARSEYYVAKTAFNKASNDLNDTRLTAPFNGYVGEVYIDRYQDVKASQPIVELVDISKLRVEIYVSADVAAAMDSIEFMNVVFDRQPDRVYRVPIVEYARNASANNLSYKATALFPNEGGRLAAGVSGKAYFDIAANSQAVTVPQTAVSNQPQTGDYVWVVSNAGVAERRRVTTGQLLPDGKIEILKGLAVGETVATSGMRFLTEGAKVECKG